MGVSSFSKLVMFCQIFAIVGCRTSNKNIVFFKDFIFCQDLVLKCKKQGMLSLAYNSLFHNSPTSPQWPPWGQREVAIVKRRLF